MDLRLPHVSPFLIGSFDFLPPCFKVFIFWILSYFQTDSWPRLPPNLWASFSLDCFLKLFTFVSSHFSAVGFNSWANGVLVMNSFPVPHHVGDWLFSPSSGTDSGFMFLSLVHLELILKQGDIGRPLGCFVCLVWLSCLFFAHWSDVRWWL